MTEANPNCPQCTCEYPYPDGELWVCPECFHEWSENPDIKEASAPKYIDAVGNELKEGDTVTTIRDLKAGNDVIKAGTKAKNIKLLAEPVNGHEISCKVPGHGQIYFTCKVVKKA